MPLEKNQIDEILNRTEEVYKNLFGSKPHKSQLLEAVERELEKRQLRVIADRLCMQRADIDLVNIYKALRNRPDEINVNVPKGSKKTQARRKSGDSVTISKSASK